MLSMKTLKVAIVAMGSALLIGPGVAVAIDLDGTGLNAPKPVVYALETLEASANVGGVKYYDLMGPAIMGVEADASASPPVLAVMAFDEMTLETTTSLRLDPQTQTETWYVRVALAGMIFRDNLGTPTVQAYSLQDLDSDPETPNVLAPTPNGLRSDVFVLAQGGDGASVAVFQLSASADAIEVNSKIALDVGDHIAVRGTAGDYSASITLHESLNDAINGNDATSFSFFGGNAAIVRLVHGTDVRIVQGAAAVASVAYDYKWFVDSPITGQENLGSIVAKERVFVGQTVLSAQTGMRAAPNDFIAPKGVSVKVEGNLSIGAFRFIRRTGADAVDCTTGAVAFTAETPDKSNLVPPEKGDTASGTFGGRDPGTYDLCVNVDVSGPATNETPIPTGDYTATVTIEGPATSGSLPEQRASGVIGSIIRDGTNVNITYLTISDKYNQRLIIVNRGSKEVTYNLNSIVTEDGVQAGLTTAAAAAVGAGLNKIGPREQVVLKVSDILAFEGDRRRAAATISINEVEANIGIVTTQVNLEDGSTDTVTWH